LAVENPFLMRKDPGYLRRLDNLAENDRKALKFGDWDVLEGRYFTEFTRDIHVVEPFEIPLHWRRYFALDFGLDGFAGLWAAFDEQGRGWVYREANGEDLLISQAAGMILSMSAHEKITAYLAPSDLWGRMADTGKSQAEIFGENGVFLARVGVRGRVDGWMNLKEWLHPFEEAGRPTANLKIFSTCRNLIKNLPLLQHDRHDPNDVDTNPHEITHAPDALRYMLAGRPCRAAVVREPSPFEPEEDDESSFLRFGT
jgi:phage terminase large subunit